MVRWHWRWCCNSDDDDEEEEYDDEGDDDDIVDNDLRLHQSIALRLQACPQQATKGVADLLIIIIMMVIMTIMVLVIMVMMIMVNHQKSDRQKVSTDSEEKIV